MKITHVKNVFDAETSADLVVKRGFATKNHYGQIGEAVPLPDGCYELTRIEPLELDGESARALVRVYSPDRGHPYEGMIICRDHLRQIFTGSEPPFVLEELPADRVAFWNHRCLMCGVNPVHDRQCASDRCRRPLHPQWPAVYCKNMCALEDL